MPDPVLDCCCASTWDWRFDAKMAGSEISEEEEAFCLLVGAVIAALLESIRVLAAIIDRREPNLLTIFCLMDCNC